jgi:hypothetical protein
MTTSAVEPIESISKLRRSAHQFLTRYAVLAWETEFAGTSWQIRLPSDVESLPAHQRHRTHARQEARRLATAPMYDLCTHSTRQALALAQGPGDGPYQSAVSATGSDDIVGTLAIEPPSPTGFVRWRAEIGHNTFGVPYAACHWGPAASGALWLVWWSDSHTLAKIYTAHARRHIGDVGQTIQTGFVDIFGPLFYDRQQQLTPSPHHTQDHPPAPSPATDSVSGGTSDTELIHATLATWWLLKFPAASQRSTQHKPPPAERTADRRAGLTPTPITHLSTNPTPEL